MEANWKWYAALLEFLINGQIVANNLLEFYLHRQPKPSLFISYDAKCSSANYKFQPGHFWPFLGTVTQNVFFSRLAKALQQFLCRKARCWTILEKYRGSRLFLRVAAIAVLYFSNKVTIRISSQINHLWYVWLILVRYKVINFVIRCEAKFSEVRLEIFKCTSVKCLLETILAPSVLKTHYPSGRAWANICSSSGYASWV